MIDREHIQKRLPRNFTVQIDGDIVSFTTTHDGKPYELQVTTGGLDEPEFVRIRIEAAIECCHRFNRSIGAGVSA